MAYEDLVGMIRGAGKRPVERNSLYEPVRVDLAYIRREAERIGEPYGLSADEVIAAAEELVSTRGR